ncbi:hypothetical protein AAJ76_20002420 [Vairimorpha ceranae]|uniref:Uncharacterized protein n=1 Tax=Vairimorpha ceranae TaxID=40302 RepID=A0A0F9WGR5_9MICR|nr:hypothetical protein AAJ76_20002420 [Vairimorpha ceranae]KKO76491.1 hypothetical protein AAJ76_20002420 [Vairimorpha ceranae]
MNNIKNTNNKIRAKIVEDLSNNISEIKEAILSIDNEITQSEEIITSSINLLYRNCNSK